MMYTVGLSKKLVLKAQLDTRFADLTTQANVTKHAPKEVEKAALEYRHLAYPPKIALMRMADPLATNATVGGWASVANLTLYHASTHANAQNFDGGNRPVVEVKGAIGILDAGGGNPTQACIGVSADGGATWTPLDGTGGTKSTVRQCGDTCGQGLSCYPYITQLHYMTGAVGYTPINFPSDRVVQLVADFGGDDSSFGNPAGYNAYCLMLNAQAQAIGYWGWIELNARERGF